MENSHHRFVSQVPSFYAAFMKFLFRAVFFLAAIAAVDGASIPPIEQEAVYLALESINSAVEWRTLYPDDVCLSGPHGVFCDVFSDAAADGFTPHVTELNFGYLSDFSCNPNCSPNATLPSGLFSSLPFLRRLFFYRCFRFRQTPIPSGFWNITPSLEELVIQDNPSLNGQLNLHIARFSRLRRLIISGTRISGNIPREIRHLRDLEQLVLSGNQLRGSIPTAVGELERLKVLDLSRNRLSGDFPSAIVRLVELVKLDFSSNRIAGPVPANFSRLKRLEFLDLSHNRLTGGVPTALAEMRSLKEVYLSGNPFGGRIPKIWQNLGGISGLGLSDVGLIGNIPPSLGLHLQNICYLFLDGNFLEGEVPKELRLLERSAKEINMENNALQGRLPFSAGFVAVIGDKLKLGGNPKLCVGDDVAINFRGNLGYLHPCNNTEIPRLALLSRSPSSPSKASLPYVVVTFLFWSLF